MWQSELLLLSSSTKAHPNGQRKWSNETGGKSESRNKCVYNSFTATHGVICNIWSYCYFGRNNCPHSIGQLTKWLGQNTNWYVNCPEQRQFRFLCTLKVHSFSFSFFEYEWFIHFSFFLPLLHYFSSELSQMPSLTHTCKMFVPLFASQLKRTQSSACNLPTYFDIQLFPFQIPERHLPAPWQLALHFLEYPSLEMRPVPL